MRVDMYSLDIRKKDSEERPRNSAHQGLITHLFNPDCTTIIKYFSQLHTTAKHLYLVFYEETLLLS